MPSFTKDVRQRIVQEFAIRHNGQFNAKLFFEEVKECGSSHPAHAWFEWDKDQGWLSHNIDRAREFARDLRVVFRIEEVTGPHSVTVRETPMPMVLSPLATRQKGGGYVLTDPDDADHIGEHCRQAARALSQWLGRYQAAAAHAGIKPVVVEALIGKLEHAASRKAA